MRKIVLILLLSVGLFANTQPYKKDILLEEVTNPTLVQVELDNEIYKNTAYDYKDVRLQSKSGEEGYFIKSRSKENIVTQKTLTASSYDRKKAKLTYEFKESFEIENIKLNIEDRNFESTVDVYVDGKLLLENQKIFDYSNETGNQNFVLKIPKVKAKKVSIIYHLDQTTSFYKKYQNLRERSKYLTIRSVTFFNNRQAESRWNKTDILLLSTETKKRESTYIFKAEGIPFSIIRPDILEKNFKREGYLYYSEDGEKWRAIKALTLSSSTLTSKSSMDIKAEVRARYIMLKLRNNDNAPLSINHLELSTRPSHLYFISNPNEAYSLYFGDKNLTKPSYELQSLVSSNDSFIKAKFLNLESLEVTKISNEVSFLEKHKEKFFIVAIFFALGVLGYVAFGLLKKSGE